MHESRRKAQRELAASNLSTTRLLYTEEGTKAAVAIWKEFETMRYQFEKGGDEDEEREQSGGMASWRKWKRMEGGGMGRQSWRSEDTENRAREGKGEIVRTKGRRGGFQLAGIREGWKF